MVNFFDNGGIIGTTLNLSDANNYIVGSYTDEATLVYVGGQSTGFTGQTSGTSTVNFNLTGGIATTPAANDIVLVAYSIGTNNSINPEMSISGYTNAFSQLFVTDTQSTEFGVSYKIMGATPDTSFTRSQTGNTQHAGAIAVHVWRNANTQNPLDVTPTTNTLTNTVLVNAPSITPTTPNTIVLVAGGGAHLNGAATYTATELSNFITVSGNDNVDAIIGLGSFAWTSGPYDPAAWTFSATSTVNYSCASASIALRPRLLTLPLLGNFKNSGIWNMGALFDNANYNYATNGHLDYSFSGTYLLPIPPGMTQISAVCIGAGGGGAGGESGRNEGVTGGAGGGLAYGTFAVTPGEVLTVVVGEGGAGGATSSDGSPGQASTISRGATVLLSGGGGQGGVERSTGIRTGGTSTGTERDGGGSGGNSGGNSTDTGSGGGGAGGYSGNGGAGGTTGAGSSGSGGGGGGGGATNAGQGYGGGGTSPYGEGTSGAGGAFNSPGFGGSDLNNFGIYDAFGPDGAIPGGGGGGCDDDTNSSGGNGGTGMVRIIFGFNRSYPSTNTGNIN